MKHGGIWKPGASGREIADALREVADLIRRTNAVEAEAEEADEENSDPWVAGHRDRLGRALGA